MNGLPSFLAALLLAGAAAGRASEVVTRCPEKTTAVQTADASIPWACVLEGARYRDGGTCPPDFFQVTTTDPYNPFRCAKRGLRIVHPRGMCPPGHSAAPTSDPAKEYDCVKIRQGFQTGPRCPRGTIPVPTPGQLKPFKCARREKPAKVSPEAEPDFSGRRGRRRKGPKRCPKGTRRTPTENPFDPFRCVKTGKSHRRMKFRRYRVRGQLTFEYPADWHLSDAWTDEVPSIYLLKDSGADGRPVSLTISRQRRTSPDFQAMNVLIRREKEWHGARETHQDKVGGLPALHLAVKGEARTAFVETLDGYYVLAFTSPPEYHSRYLPAYLRLLRSFKHLGGRKR